MYKYVVSDGQRAGYVEIKDDTLTFNLPGKAFETRMSYVQNIEKLHEIGLNKCTAKLTYYSLMAELRTVEFIIAIHELAALKKVVGK